MDPEPKRPIEKMLESSAEARRAAFGRAPTMPNPVRAQLHDEIARLERTKESGSGVSWFQLFWPRLGVAAALATVLVVGSSIWWRRSHDSSGGRVQVAEGRGPEGATADETFAKGPAAAAPAPNVSLADDSRARLEPEHTPPAVASADSLSSESTISAQPNPAAPAAMSKGLVSQSEKAAGREIDQTSASHNQLAARAAAPGAATQQFRQRANSQSFRNSVQSQRGLNILNDFQVQQQGDEIRVVDSDGSTYTGQVERANELRLGAAHAKKAAPERLAEESSRPHLSPLPQGDEEEAKQAEASQTRFRATGYNVSLKKAVTFEGNFSQVPVPQTKAAGAALKDEKGAGAQARIVGTAKVKGEQPVQVDAIAVGGEPAEKNQQ